jgi:hypothetical protein
MKHEGYVHSLDTHHIWLDTQYGSQLQESHFNIILTSILSEVVDCIHETKFYAFYLGPAK